MKRLIVSLAGVVMAVGLLPAQPSQRPPQPPPPQQTRTFRATTDVVAVDVSVRVDGRQLTGLSAADFELRDNGERQRVTVAEAAAVPIDLTLIVDVSGDWQGTWQSRRRLDEVSRKANGDLQRIAVLLRPEDRLRVMAIDTYGTEVSRLAAPRTFGPIEIRTAGGLSSLFDTLTAALLQPVEVDRRHVIVARTKGIDTISATDVESLVTTAGRSDALLHLVLDEGTVGDDLERSGFQGSLMGLSSGVSRFWVPHRTSSVQQAELVGFILTETGRRLVEGAESTGGALHRPVLLSEPTLVGTFQRAFEDFRQSYVLRYTPQGVKREGWHEIRVSVPSRPNAVIRARRGYAIEAIEPAPRPATTTTPGPPATAGEYVAAVDRREFDVVRRALLRTPDPTALIRDFRAAGNPWPATPTREATFVLELAEAGLFSRRESARSEARAMLETYTRFVRHPLDADAFERQWHRVVMTIVLGTIRPDLAEPFVRRALARFPGDSRVVFAEAIVADQRLRQRSPTGGPDAEVAEAVARYEAAIAAPDTADEARVRLAWLLHRTGRPADALKRLDEIDEARSPDTPMRYWLHLIRGHALDATDRLGEAIAAYRSALVLVPQAQSARVALMNALLRAGERPEALALAEQIQTAPANAPDPWWSYWQADLRFYDGALARLREIRR